MTTERTKRLKFAAAQVFVGLIGPLLCLKLFTIFSFSKTSFVEIGYFLIFPSACFLLLSGLALLRNGDQFLVTRSGLWGAAIAAYLVFALPYALLGIASATYSGGGANIGLGLLVLIAPVALPISMFIGLKVGEPKVQGKAPNLTFKRDAEKRGAP